MKTNSDITKRAMTTAGAVAWQPSALYQGAAVRGVCQGSLTFRLKGDGLSQGHALRLEGIERKNQGGVQEDRSRIQI